jgi:Lhr-like helicase
MAMSRRDPTPLASFHPAVRAWFERSFPAPTAAQAKAWPAIARGESTLLLAPTGSGKTLAAFLACLDRLMFRPVPPPKQRCRVVYVSPLKALAVDVEKNLRAPLAGIAHAATELGVEFHAPEIAIRTGDTPPAERARFARAPADILITTPESLYLLLTSNGREALRAVDTVIVDEIHALAPTKRGSHLALSIERLEWLCGQGPHQGQGDRALQRVGLSATQRPLEEIAHFLGGVAPKPAAGARAARSRTAARRVANVLNKKLIKIKFSVSGVCAVFQKEKYNEKRSLYFKNICIYFAGPISNIILAYVFGKNIMIKEINIFLAILNLLPIFPLDGYNVLLNIFRLIFTKEKSKNIMNILGNVFIAILTIIAIYQSLKFKNFSMIIFCVYLYVLKLNKRD